MIKQLLDEAATRINTPGFIPHDPVQFPRRFSRQQDIEIVALLVSHISWGRREMILRDAERLLAYMQGDPYHWITTRAYLDIDDRQNIHRTFFGTSLKYFCRGLSLLYSRHTTLEQCLLQHSIHTAEQPAWRLAALLNALMAEANNTPTNLTPAAGKQISASHPLPTPTPPDKFCLPQNLNTTALKRLNMALRWLVRDDGIVDLGVWHALTPAQLFIPLDVHVADTSRRLNLITRRQNDRRTVIELTSRLRSLNPADPCLYDFALFGLGIEQSKT